MAAKRTTNPSSATGLLVAREIALGKGQALAAAADRTYPPNTLDKLSGISPGWSARRRQARMEATIMAGGYDITQPRRTRRQRANRGADGPADNAQDDRTLWEIRETCRDHDRNSGLLHGLIERGVDNIAGPEYQFRPASGDEAFDRDAAELLKENSVATEYRGLFNLQNIITLGMRSLYPDGDLLLNHLAGNRIQVLEAHELVTPVNGKGWRDRRVIGGVELDDQGRHAAYYLRDPRQPYNYGYSGWVQSHEQAQRLPAASAQHLANRHRFSQTRGVPLLAPLLDMFDMLDGYLDAEMLAAKINADVVYGIRRPQATSPLPGVSLQDDLNSTTDSETTFDKLLRSEPGMILDLLAGEDFVSIGNSRPGDTFQPYVMTILRMLGASIGMPLELVLLDFSQTNYSSARAALLQAYRCFKRLQLYLRDWLIQPIYNRWMSRWIAAGELPPIDGAYKLLYLPPRWAWIDPLKEVLAMEKQIAAGAGSLDQWVSETGGVFEDLSVIREKELKILRAKNIPTTTAPDNLETATNQNQATNPTNPTNQPNQPTQPDQPTRPDQQEDEP